MRNGSIIILLIAGLSLLMLPIDISSQEPGDIRFSHLTVEDGLISNNAACILQDSRGFFWIGTTSGGLSQYDGVEFISYINDQNDPNSIANNYTWRLYKDKNENMWAITWGGGLSRYDPVKDIFINYTNNINDENSLSSILVWSALVDRDDILWVGTDNGLDKYDAERGQFIHYRHDQNNPFSLSNNSV